MSGSTHLGGKFFISTSIENFDLDESGFVSLEYQQIPNMGNMGDTGVDQAQRTYAVFGQTLRHRTKEIAVGAELTVEFLQVKSVGLDLLSLAAEANNTNQFAFMILWPDGSVEYFRGIVSGHRLLKGGGEDFKRVEFTIGITQAPLVIDYEPQPDNDPYFVSVFFAPT